MNIQLPPRRVLPPEVKERMRPRLPRSASRRAPLAAAAVVVLLAAGGVVLTRSAQDRGEPLTPPLSSTPTSTSTTPPPDMRPRTEPTTADDLVRCAVDGLRARFTLVKPGVRLVVGEDWQFCELTYTRVATSSASPPRLTLAGDADSTVVWQSATGVVVVTAPENAREVVVAKTAEGSPEPGGVLRDGLAFVWQLQDDTITFVLPDRQVTATVDPIALHSPTHKWYQARDAFPGGGADPTTAANQAARCVDFGLRQPAHPLIREPGWDKVGDPGRWRPGARVGGGTDSAYGLLVLHDGAGGLGFCELNDGLAASMSWARQEPTGDSPARLAMSMGFSGTLLVSGPVTPEVGEVELTDQDGQPFEAQVLDGTWAAKMGSHTGGKIRMKVLDRAGAVLHEGELAVS